MPLMVVMDWFIDCGIIHFLAAAQSALYQWTIPMYTMLIQIRLVMHLEFIILSPIIQSLIDMFITFNNITIAYQITCMFQMFDTVDQIQIYFSKNFH